MNAAAALVDMPRVTLAGVHAKAARPHEFALDELADSRHAKLTEGTWRLPRRARG
jgi:hypothetical protein